MPICVAAEIRRMDDEAFKLTTKKPPPGPIRRTARFRVYNDAQIGSTPAK